MILTSLRAVSVDGAKKYFRAKRDSPEDIEMMPFIRMQAHTYTDGGLNL